MISRATVDRMIDRARATQARIDRGELAGRDLEVQAECRETLATVDAYLATLPAAMQAVTSGQLVARLEARERFTATVPPKRRTVVSHAAL